MALDKQFAMYSVDTGHFYSNREKYLHNMNRKYREERNYVNNSLKEIKKALTEKGYTHNDIYRIGNEQIDDIQIIPETDELVKECARLEKLVKHKRRKANQSKEKILTLIKNKVEQNEKTDGKDHIRVLRGEELNDNCVISVFDSALSRAIGAKQDELTDALIVVQVYYFDVFKDLSYYGFIYNGEKYKYFTSSAGQIRKKKAVFIKESIWENIEKTIMCGLTISKINSHGGNNVNKHLAYMALTNSATDEWTDFDIDRCIVIDDFETNVWGTFDFIDETNYTVTRKTDYVPIPHTDGAGMILPELSKKNFMTRLPWIKGLLGSFDFIKFIKIHNFSPLIKDIYGTEHNILEENIQIIFTKSQFKAYKHYSSWQEYKDCFKTYNCRAGICNVEEDKIKNAKINYQMLQTLTDITDEEISVLTRKSSEKIKNICTSKEIMMTVLGITPSNTKLTAFQKAVKIYPPLLGDTYAKDVIRDVKDSLIKKYRSGKLEVTGKYTFVLPDFYAACEYWFGHIEQPKGLLADGEVFCNLFPYSEKLDCLRSPHLYKEHPIRKNVACESFGGRAERIREWFHTNGIYTSTYDLITKIVQLDVDGDKLLVVADKDFVRIAERNMKDIVPLYYNMKKAEPILLNNKSIYNGLNQAFAHGNIGIYSNNISKIWNSDVFVNGTEEEKSEALKVIKLLCMENNFQIDAAKTMFMPARPAWFKSLVSKYTNQKLPAFFEYAKDKKKHQVLTRNASFVNKIFDRIQNTKINIRGMNLGELNYEKLMSNKNLRCTREVSALYDTLSKQYRFMVNMKDEYNDNLHYIACEIRNAFAQTGYSEETVTDMLVQYLYGNKKRFKQLLWFCYGNRIVYNLKNNTEPELLKSVQCIDCGEWFETKQKNTLIRRCPLCDSLHKRDLRQQINRKYYAQNKN